MDGYDKRASLRVQGFKESRAVRAATLQQKEAQVVAGTRHTRVEQSLSGNEDKVPTLVVSSF